MLQQPVQSQDQCDARFSQVTPNVSRSVPHVSPLCPQGLSQVSIGGGGGGRGAGGGGEGGRAALQQPVQSQAKCSFMSSHDTPVLDKERHVLPRPHDLSHTGGGGGGGG